MIDNLQNTFNSSTNKFFQKRKNNKNDLDRLLSIRACEKKYLINIASNELIEKGFKRKKDLKNYELEEIRRRRLENIYSVKRKVKNQTPGTLCINSEKKQIIERTPEIEKKPMPKPSIQAFATNKGIFQQKNVQTVQIIIPEVSTLNSAVSVPKIGMNSYENWKTFNKIPLETKVFIIAGNYPDIRKALIQRGWFENTDPESQFFDLKWSRNARVPSSLQEWQLFNHFPRNFELSVKWQLYENLKHANRMTNSKYLNFFPRSFRLDSKGFDEFFENFKAVFTISMLKQYVLDSNLYYAEQIIVGNIVCKRWINELEKELYLNERITPLVMNVEWKIITSKDLSEIQSAYQRLMLGPCGDLYGTTCKNLEILEQVDPQFLMNGKKNIWIVKAGRKSRGRDICLFTDINQLKTYTSYSSCWVVQKYIENPLIIQNKKFDIRQWVLISNSDPLTIWIYKRSYLRFSLEEYSDNNIDNPYIHLTNNSISKTSKKFENSEIIGCMWSIDQFQSFLIAENGCDLWGTQIYPALKKIVKNSLLTVGNLGRKKSFEILGYDFMIDDKFKPWLLEINSSPAMDYSTVINKQNVTEILVKEVLEDAIKVIVDYPNGIADTGNFEICYKSNNYIPIRKSNN